jgi:hypothetical protein
VNGDGGIYHFGSGDTIRGAFAVSANTASYTMLIDLTGYAGAGSGEGADPGVYDVGHTVKFKVLLPDGVTGHSASGLLPFYDANGNLIGEAAGAVPEPSAVYLTLSGAALLVVARFRRKRRA